MGSRKEDLLEQLESLCETFETVESAYQDLEDAVDGHSDEKTIFAVRLALLRQLTKAGVKDADVADMVKYAYLELKELSGQEHGGAHLSL